MKGSGSEDKNRFGFKLVWMVGICSSTPLSKKNRASDVQFKIGNRMRYYLRTDVRRALANYMSPSDGLVREGAVYNRRVKSIQRYITVGDQRIPMKIDSTALDFLLKQGAIAFYGTYWRYDAPGLEPVGRDLVWAVRAVKGGISEAKEITTNVLEGFKEIGVDLWLKYDGNLGFDLVLPLEGIPQEIWMGNPSALDELHQKLTVAVVGYLRERLPDAEIVWQGSKVKIVRESGESLLSELRIRRGLLLAPMSLNPSTGLVSLPLNPDEVNRFLPIDATTDFVKATEWRIPTAPFYVLQKLFVSKHAQAASF